MSYRSLKRVLGGETSLERKCRLLFGSCLILLLGFAFWWVDNIAETLVIKTTNRIGRDWANQTLFNMHWEIWESKKEGEAGLSRDLRRDLLLESYDSVIMAVDHGSMYSYSQGTVFPSHKAEEELLRGLKERWLTTRPGLETSDDSAAETSDDGEQPSDMLVPAFDVLPKPDEGQYIYYQAVYWRESCVDCHAAMHGDVFAAGAHQRFLTSPPFRAIKVTIPYTATKRAINSTRAILIAVGILTVFVAMVALYIIVRYVIVKPLTHLRDISDEISRGNQNLRAEIQTNDEFEDLAASFNRMLRHLTDAQGELRQVNSDLDAKVDELAQLNVQLYESNRVKSDFLANMSHELRTPLNSIIGFSEVLQDIDSLNDKQKRYAGNIRKSGRLLLEMINDILDLAKVEAGKMQIKASEFKLGTIVTAQCDMVRSLTEEKNIDLNVSIEDGLPLAFQDQSKVQQVLTNLLSNAIKFTPDGGCITVTGSDLGDGRFEVGVADTGVGIAEEDREIIFEKFRQSRAVEGEDGLTREYSGTGLGLSIVKEMCKLLGGEVTFESELGTGSTFRVTLPWNVKLEPSRESEIASRIDELTRPQRVDFQRAQESPQPPVASASECR